MAYTQADIDRLKKSMAQGVRKVTYSDGRAHEFYSLAEMQAQLTRMESEVAGDAASSASRSVIAVNDRCW
ncbi:hypothetical protein J2X65_001658 [Ancylobacter sp. 3268]|uniref:phage head-tail joining protein n=1 Tax=Ancylobacter sp. 3268 TaxID=2817752 RepID=UPI002861498D|nr:hypothetical protein [Ancylobacter sp. 3268]MDR6952303.1 hypothetical protein [Ancylobacter sp. 3268]